MSQPLVSVIIPSYNHEQYVQETINAVINQTYQNVELIVVDDNSSDLTFEKILELKQKCEERFVRFVCQKNEQNKGISANLNTLYSLSEGEYIFITASDDIPEPKAVETLVNFLKENPNYVLAVGDNQIVDSKSQKCFWLQDRKITYDENLAKFKTFASWLQCGESKFDFSSDKFGTYNTFVYCNYIPNGYMYRHVFKNSKNPFPEEKVLEDWWLMMQLSKYGKMKFINEVLFSYRWHDNNTIVKTDYVSKLTKKTILYEEENVNHLKNKKWRRIFYKAYAKEKNIFSVLSLVKVKTPCYKKIYLCIFGLKILLCKKKIL